MTGYQGYMPPPPPPQRRMRHFSFADIAAEHGAGWGREYEIDANGRRVSPLQEGDLQMGAALLVARRLLDLCDTATVLLGEVRPARREHKPAKPGASETEQKEKSKRLRVQSARLRAMRAYLRAGGVDDCHYMTRVEDAPFAPRARAFLLGESYRRVGDVTAAKRFELARSPTGSFELADLVRDGLRRLGLSLAGEPEPDAPPEPVDVPAGVPPLIEWEFSVRVRRALVNRLGLTTAAELVAKTADDLMECKNFGATSLAEVREKLKGYGLRLAGDPT